MRFVVLCLLLLAGCTDLNTADAVEAPLEPVRAHIISNEQWAWEPSGAMNPVDPDHYVVAYRHGSHNTMSVRTTFDGGHTWSSSTIAIGADASGPAAEWTATGDPVVFFAPEGTLYVGGLGRTIEYPGGAIDRIQHGSHIFVARSDDGGLNFQDVVVVAAGSGTVIVAGNVQHADNYVNQDRPWFAAGAGGILLAAWNELGHDGQRTTIDGQSAIPYDGNEFQFGISRDGGASWTVPETLSHGGWPGALVREDGTFVLAHSSHQTGKLSILTSSDGNTWKWQELGIGHDQPVLREYRGDLLVATTGVLQGQKVPAYYRVADKTTGPWMFASGQDLNPFTNLAVDPAGGFWASWYGTNGTYNLARFGDDSQWPVERRVVAHGIDARLHTYGDYVDTLAVGTKIYVVWNDWIGEDNRALHVSVY